MPLAAHTKATPPRRLLYIVGTYPSPTETFIGREIQGLRQMGLDIRVLPLTETSPLRGLAPALGTLPRLNPLLKALRNDRHPATRKRGISAILRAAALLRECRGIPHIHAHFLGLPATVAFCLSRLLGVPFSLTAHAHDIYSESTPEIVIREALFRTTCTQANADYLNHRYPGSPFHLVRHGLNPEPYAASHQVRTTPPCRLLAIGRLVEKKGLDFLLKACHELQKRDFPYACTIIGEGPLRERLLNRVNSLGLMEEVHLLPFQEHAEIIRHYQTADLLVIPSVTAEDGDRDGVPNVILEAMAAGLPVVGTDAGSIHEAICDGETGLLVAQKDPQAIANAISTLWNEPSSRARLSKQASEFVGSEFNLATWLERLRDKFSRAET